MITARYTSVMDARNEIEERINAKLARMRQMADEMDAIVDANRRLLDSMYAWEATTRPEARIYIDEVTA
jgi:hypothetical protein